MHRFEREQLRRRTDSVFAETRTIRFQDVDAAGIIFYPRLLEYCHDTLVAFFAAAGAPLHENLRSPTWLAPIRHAEADYFRPLRFGDPIEVAIVAAVLLDSEVSLGFRIARTDKDEVSAVAQSVHTFVTPATFQRCRVPEPLRAAFLKIGG
ncbi:MAG: acyl-CoA thioesterase [Myxococcota bacterium]|jgi:1,4-dihydroxy-2-naphthoyl-CoA hydrolase|nr:acyl-CoA thioesterase [Myxococcota bacterium]